MKLKRILALVLCLALLCSFAVRAEGLDQDAESVGEIESVVETVSEETVEGETAGVSGTQLATDETSPAFDVTHDGSDDVLLSPNATTGTGNTWQGSIIEEDTVLELAGNAVVSLREPDNTNDRAGNFVVMSGVTLTLKG